MAGIVIPGHFQTHTKNHFHTIQKETIELYFINFQNAGEQTKQLKVESWGHLVIVGNASEELDNWLRVKIGIYIMVIVWNLRLMAMLINISIDKGKNPPVCFPVPLFFGGGSRPARKFARLASICCCSSLSLSMKRQVGG